jgi:AraC-like DNA-binding protein
MSFHELRIQMSCPVKAYNAGLFISRGSAMHPTRIIDSHELIFVTRGELNMWEGEQTFHLKSGDTLHLWPGRQHGSTKPMPSDLRFYWIHFEIDDAQAVKGNSYVPLVRMPQTAQLSNPEVLERLFRSFLSAQETGTLLPLSANLMTMLMLLEVAQQSDGKIDSDGLNVVATWAHTYIFMNFDRPITAGTVAEALGYNIDYLGRIYRETYRCTLTEAIQRRRIEKSCEYLLNANATISQIALKCGFSDPDYFRRIFKRFMQITPSDYRDDNSRFHVNTH